MRAIDHFNLRSFDLNLLLAFDALMQELSVTRAAERLRVQQPAMSHALAALRTLLEDPLFVRVGARMEPTPRAEALSLNVRRILQETQEVLLRREEFDPARAVLTFRIGVNLELEMNLLPALAADLGAAAPGIAFVTHPVSRQNAFALLDQGLLDLVIGVLPGRSSWHAHLQLYEETHSCCFNPALTGLTAPLGLEDYQGARHGFVSAQDDPAGALGEALARRGIRPRIAVSSPNFITLAATALGTPIVATMATSVARQCSLMLGLATSPLPFELDPLPIDMVWHTRSQGDPASAWVRRQIAAVMTPGPAEPAAASATRSS